MQKIITDVKIDKVVFKGYGLGHSYDKTVFVHKALPGMTVDVIVHKETRSIIQGSVDKYHDSFDPICSSYITCGGCDWLPADYDNQIQWKSGILSEFYNELLYIPVDVKQSESIYHYRNKTIYPLGTQNGKPVAGMFGKRSHKIVTHSTCKLQPEIFDRITDTFLEYLNATKGEIYNEKNAKGIFRFIGFRYSEYEKKVLVFIVVRKKKIPFTKQLVRMLTSEFPEIKGIILNINRNDGNTILGDEEKLIFGYPDFFEELDSLKFNVNYKAFFQVNKQQAEKMIQYAKSFLNKQDRIIDAYCGAGTFGLCAADSVEYVLGLEENEDAVKNAVENAEFNNICNADFIACKVENEIESRISKHNINTLIFDPPRKGLDTNFISESIMNNINKIIYVSCNPSTQKRDVDLLTGIGFKLKSLTGFDLFPHTYHIESVAILEK